MNATVWKHQTKLTAGTPHCVLILRTVSVFSCRLLIILFQTILMHFFVGFTRCHLTRLSSLTSFTAAASSVLSSISSSMTADVSKVNCCKNECFDSSCHDSSKMEMKVGFRWDSCLYMHTSSTRWLMSHGKGSLWSFKHRAEGSDVCFIGCI